MTSAYADIVLSIFIVAAFFFPVLIPAIARVIVTYLVE